MKTILDISRHQNGIKLNSLTGVDGFIYRASIGTSSIDTSFKDFISQNNKPVGLYVRSYAKNISEAEAEADYICDIAREYCKNKPVIFFDWEYFSATYIKNKFGIVATANLVQNMTEAFCDRVIKNGFKTGVYFNLDYLNRFYTREFFEKHSHYYKWYARPRLATPDYKCDLWQYRSNNGAEFGYNGDIDKNIQYTEFDDVIYVEPMKPLDTEPIRMCIGIASDTDIAKIVTQINGLGIETEVDDGFIYTGLVSKGDQCSIMLTCNNLGIAYKQYQPITFVAIESEKSEESSDNNSNIELLSKIYELLLKIAKFLKLI